MKINISKAPNFQYDSNINNQISKLTDNIIEI